MLKQKIYRLIKTHKLSISLVLVVIMAITGVSAAMWVKTSQPPASTTTSSGEPGTEPVTPQKTTTGQTSNKAASGSTTVKPSTSTSGSTSATGGTTTPGSTPSPTPAPTVIGSCVQSAGSAAFKATTANGFRDNPSSGSIYDNSSVPAGRVFDATGTTWLYGLINAVDAPQIYGTRIRGGDNVCWSGGRYIGTSIDSEHPDWETWHDLNGFRVGGMHNFIFENIYVRNFGDLLNFSDDNGDVSTGWTVRDSLLRHSHDDCIQNDKFGSGKISGSFFDGCYTGLSARMSDSDHTAGVIDGSNSLLEVENSLFWMQPMTPVYKGENPGHGNFLKWQNDTPERGMKLSLKNVVLMARQNEDDELDNNAGSKLVTCQNVTIIWLGAGAFPGTGWPAGCVTVVTGTAGQNLWLQKVAEWYAAHPQYADLKPADSYYFSYNP